jgi:uncharacterized protein
MVKIPIEIKDKINRFLQKLKESNIIIQKAILFGSFANEKYHEFSDIDIALVSSSFTGNPYYDNELIRDAKFAVSYDIEAHTYTQDGFNEGDPFVREILKNGIEIA